MVRLKSKVSVPEHVLFREVSGEAVLLNQETGKYFTLDETGTRMWLALQEQGQVQAGLDALLKEYEVSKEQLQGDLLELVQKLEQSGLLQVD